MSSTLQNNEVSLLTSQASRVKTQAGQHYKLRKPGPDGQGKPLQLPDNLIATREGDALQVRYADGSSVVFEDFYTVCKDASVCSVTLVGDSEAGFNLSADTASGGMATSDGSTLVYAHGDQDVLMSKARGDAALAAGTLGEVAVVPGLAGLLLSAEAWAHVTTAGIGAGVSHAVGLVLGVIQAGPVTAGNDLEVTLYAADGSTVLAEHVVVDSAGHFSATVGSYTGVIIAKLINKGVAADYLDEATNAARDLNATLFAAGVVRTPGATLSLNLNALSTLAYYQLGADHSAAHVDAVNAAVAHAFGLDNLQTTTVTATNSGSYNPADGLSEGEKYGAVLAALSGMDKLNDGSVQATLDRLNSQLSVSGTTATLSDAAKYEIAAGAKTVASLASNAVVTGLFGDTVSALIHYSSNPETQAQGLAVISASAGAAAGAAPPSVFDYANANVTGVDSAARLQLINGVVHAKAATEVDSTAEVQALVDAYSAILLEANGVTADATPGVNPSAAQYAAIGASIGAAASDAENLSLLNDMLAGQSASGVDTVAEIDNLARIANAIELTAAGGTPSPALTPADFVLIGISGVNDSNLATMLGAIAGQNDNGTATDSLAELQALVSSTPPAAPVVNTVAGDNFVNATEASAGFNITGTGEIGATVTLNFGSGALLLGGNTVLVGADGTWSLHLSASDIAALGQGLETLSATQTNTWGNTSASAGTGSFTVDTVAPFSTIATATFNADTGTAGDFLTKTAAQTIAGTLSANLQAGESVQVSLDNGGHWATASNSTNNWSLAGQTLGGSNTLLVKVTDAAGNSGAVFSQAYVLDTLAPTVSTVTDDVTASVTAGVIHFTVSFDEALVGTVGTGNFSASNGTVTAVAALGANLYLVSVTPTTNLASGTVSLSLVGGSLTDAAGNTVTNANLAGKDSQGVDTLAAALNVTSIAGDTVAGANQTGVFDATERGAAPTTVATPLVVVGSTDAEAGQTVTVTLNNHNYQSVVAAGTGGQLNTWSVTLPDADVIALNHGNHYGVLVAVTDLAGTLSNNNSDLLFYNVAFPDTPTILNNNTNSSTPTLTGQAQKIVNAAGNLSDPANYTALAAGDTLAVVINGVHLNATIGSGAATNVAGVSYVAASNTWAVDTSAVSGFAPLANGSYDIAVSVTAGGVTKSDISHNELVINSALPAISLNAVATDGTLNAVEITQPLQVTGVTDAQVGQTVTVALNGHNYIGIVQAGVDATHNTFSVNVAAADLLALADGSYPVDASVTNIYGDTNHTTPSLTVDTQAPQVSTVTDGTGAALTNSSIAFTVSFNEAVVGSVGIGSFTASNASVTSVSSLGGNQYLVSVTPTVGLASGTVALSLVGTGLGDAAGNLIASASLSGFDSQGIDTLAPTQVVSTVALSADTAANGGGNTDLITNTAAQTIAATLSAGLAVGDVLYGSVDGGSTWLDISNKVSGSAISWNGATLSGSSTIVFKLSDALGNTGANTGSTGYVLDVVAPSATIATAMLSTDSGSAGDFITNTAAQTISGTLSTNLALGEVVYVSLNNGGTWAMASAIVGSNSWSLVNQTLDASGTLLVKVTDLAGNDGTVYSHAYSVDSSAPTLSTGTAPATNLSTVAGTAGNSTGETIVLTITFDGNVNGLTSGSDSTVLKVSGTGVSATWGGTTGSSTRTLTYTVQAGDNGQATIDEAALKTALIAGISDAAGNAFSYTANGSSIANIDSTALPVIDTTAPTAPALALATDSGSSGSDGVTNVATVSVTGLESNSAWQYKVDSGSWTNGSGSSFTLSNDGLLHSYVVHQTDQAGNLGGDSAPSSYTLDTTAPTATVTAATLSNSASATIQSTEAGSAYLVASTVTVTNLASITGAADDHWNTVSISTANSNTNLPLAGLVDGTYHLYTTDAAGNLSAASSSALTVSSITAGQAIIDLGANGKLIAPVLVDGHWFYYWDRSGDGTNGGSDTVTHNVLDALFNHDINGVTNTTVANADTAFGTTDTYRYNTTLSTLKLALPTYGDSLDGSSNAANLGWHDLNQTSIGNAVASLGDPSINPTYNDLLAIWDAYNGTGTATDASNAGNGDVGVPPATWVAAGSAYWSATTTTSGHAATSLDYGIVTDNADTGTFNVLIQVVDNVAPVFSSAAAVSVAENKGATDLIYDAQAADNQGANVTDTMLTYSLSGVDASHFAIDATNGQVTLATGSSLDYEAPTDVGADNVYNINVIATDPDHNATTQAVAITVTNVADSAGTTTINLGSYGNLIAPVQVEGNWYYFWDMSANGSAGAGDSVNHNFLDALFNHDINGVTNTTIANADGLFGTTDTYRYATISGVKVAVATVGMGTLSYGLQPGTSVNSGAVNNPTYDDLLAIWDAGNGAGTGTGASGLPVTWGNGGYWSSTPSTSGHAYVTYTGTVVNTIDNGGASYVVLQVL